MTNDELFRLHAKSRFNEFEISQSELHGCFYCCKIYKTSDTLDNIQWSDMEYANGKYARTAVCSSCCVDSLLASVESEKITLEILLQMNKFWFGETKLEFFIDCLDEHC